MSQGPAAGALVAPPGTRVPPISSSTQFSSQIFKNFISCPFYHLALSTGRVTRTLLLRCNRRIETATPSPRESQIVPPTSFRVRGSRFTIHDSRPATLPSLLAARGKTGSGVLYTCRGTACRARLPGLPCPLARPAVPACPACRARLPGLPCPLARPAVPACPACRARLPGLPCPLARPAVPACPACRARLPGLPCPLARPAVPACPACRARLPGLPCPLARPAVPACPACRARLPGLPCPLARPAATCRGIEWA